MVTVFFLTHNSSLRRDRYFKNAALSHRSKWVSQTRRIFSWQRIVWIPPREQHQGRLFYPIYWLNSYGLPYWCCSKQGTKSLSPVCIPGAGRWGDGAGACIATLGISPLAIRLGKWSGWVGKAPTNVHIQAWLGGGEGNKSADVAWPWRSSSSSVLVDRHCIEIPYTCCCRWAIPLDGGSGRNDAWRWWIARLTNCNYTMTRYICVRGN